MRPGRTLTHRLVRTVNFVAWVKRLKKKRQPQAYSIKVSSKQRCTTDRRKGKRRLHFKAFTVTLARKSLLVRCGRNGENKAPKLMESRWLYLHQGTVSLPDVSCVVRGGKKNVLLGVRLSGKSFTTQSHTHTHTHTHTHLLVSFCAWLILQSAGVKGCQHPDGARCAQLQR